MRLKLKNRIPSTQYVHLPHASGARTVAMAAIHALSMLTSPKCGVQILNSGLSGWRELPSSTTSSQHQRTDSCCHSGVRKGSIGSQCSLVLRLHVVQVPGLSMGWRLPLNACITTSSSPSSGLLRGLISAPKGSEVWQWSLHSRTMFIWDRMVVCRF